MTVYVDGLRASLGECLWQAPVKTLTLDPEKPCFRTIFIQVPYFVFKCWPQQKKKRTLCACVS